MPKKILFIISHSIKTGPSQRFRIGLYLPYLAQAGLRYKVRSFYSPAGGKIIAQNGKALGKAGVVLLGFLKRLYTVFLEAWRYDYIFIQREAAPFGPPVFEWILAKLLRKKIIFDFDDAIWLQDQTERGWLYSLVKARWKVQLTCKWSYKISAGNDYLSDFAKNYNDDVVKIPTCVDTDKMHNQLKQHSDDSQIVVGWTGSHSTLVYLQQVAPVIGELQRNYHFPFLVICNKPATDIMPDALFIKWKEETEVSDLLQMDVGIMPLSDNEWSKGKCGFKLIQYMSLGIPVVASRVGVNGEIVQDGVEGFLCENEAEWQAALQKLLDSPELRKSMGENGRRKVEGAYSIKAFRGKFIDLFS